MAEPGLTLGLRRFGNADYLAVWQAMREFTERRDGSTADQLWLGEHPPVYTLGRNGDPSHILDAGAIPVVQTDRGGQVTYHGPDQLVAYTLLDLNRLGIGVRSLVHGLERAVVATLAQYGIRAQPRADAPGVYVDGRKIASLGLRIRNGRSYHGLSLNVDLELAPFRAINPCGFAGLEVTSLAELGVAIKPYEAAVPLIGQIVREFGYQGVFPAD